MYGVHHVILRPPPPQVWRQYWDYQLYKALEYQYTQGLECINKTLPEVEIKMVFRQHKLQVGGRGGGGRSRVKEGGGRRDGL